ncbi:MAG: acyl--CoA ligase, partial [Mycobacterium sp.]|nr:acyl--CoA ligase [Mycobacterium sp.]
LRALLGGDGPAADLFELSAAGVTRLNSLELPASAEELRAGVRADVAEIAALRAGMVKVPLNFRFHPREVRQALDDCEPAVLVSDAGFAERLLALGPLPPSVRAVWTVGGTLADCARLEHATESGEPLAQCVEHGPDDPILIRYTGGTTGRPKGIVHTAASFTGIHLDVVRELSLRPDDVALHLGHLSHGLNFMW